MSRSHTPRRAARASQSKICVIGAGYVGIPTAGVLASRGHDVVLAERDDYRFKELEKGNLPIVEPGLQELIDEGRAAGKIHFVRSALEGVQDCDFVFLCVPTPQGDDGAADLSYVKEASREIGPHLAPGCVVINKSTVPVGTADLVARAIGRTDISVVSNPEFLREGTAVADSLHPDRIVVGSNDAHAASAVAELFAGMGGAMVLTDPTTAETIKYASNAFLATKISFVNAMAALCEAVGADIKDLVLGLGFDKRIGFEFLSPGPGWGGSCFPKDTAALVHIGKEHGYEFSLLQGAIDCNVEQIERVTAKIAAMAGDLKGATIGVWGVTFKAETDDRRSSPAIAIVRKLVDAGARVRVYDPTLSERDRDAKDLAGVEITSDPFEAARDAKVVALLTEWQMFRWLDHAQVSEVMEVPAIVDARNLLDPDSMKRHGFRYMGIGRS